MLKRFCVIISALIVVCGAIMIASAPVFKGYGDNYEVYLNSSSSLATAVSASQKDMLFLRSVKGECVKVSAEGFDLEQLFKEFNAELKFIEQTVGIKTYYAYSPKIKYRKTVRGERVNLQVAVGKEQVTLGTPLIFGSF